MLCNLATKLQEAGGCRCFVSVMWRWRLPLLSRRTRQRCWQLCWPYLAQMTPSKVCSAHFHEELQIPSLPAAAPSTVCHMLMVYCTTLTPAAGIRALRTTAIADEFAAYGWLVRGRPLETVSISSCRATAGAAAVCGGVSAAPRACNRGAVLGADAGRRSGRRGSSGGRRRCVYAFESLRVWVAALCQLVPAGQCCCSIVS